jgi:hypothetical protein
MTEDLGLEPGRGTSFFSSSKGRENDLTQHPIPQIKEIFLRVKETVDEFISHLLLVTSWIIQE